MTVTATEDEWEQLQAIEPRIVTLDIEVDDRGDGFPRNGEERVLSIVAHDNYSDETVAFIDTHGRTDAEVRDMLGIADENEIALEAAGLADQLDSWEIQDSERQMLIAFRSWFTSIGPDLVTGWNVDDFDMKYLIQRMSVVGASAHGLSPLGYAGLDNRDEPRIKGVTIYDLLTVYKKNSYTALRSHGLDDVAKEELGAEKIEFGGSFYSLYDSELTKFIEYNTRDVELTHRINQEAGVIEFRDVLRREVGVAFEESYNANDFIEVMCRRKLKERGEVGPTATASGGGDYEGAHVFEPYNGLAENVVGVDLSSLYPYTMAMLNASPEMRVEEDDIDPATPHAKAANGAHFQLDEDGLFRELVNDAISLKSDYKAKRNAADTDEEYEFWADKYASAKRITNSIYGVTGWERFFLYDEPVAEAITLTGQAVIKRTAEWVSEESGLDVSVIYGDTDSVYMKFPDSLTRDKCIDAAQRMCTALNEKVYPQLATEHGIPAEDNLWKIEVEAYMRRYFQAGRKKRYAYLAEWKDGRLIEDPEPSISGFSSQRSDSSEITEQTERRVLDAILHGNTDAVGDIIFDSGSKITNNDPDWEAIGIPGGFGKRITGLANLGERDDYYNVSCQGSSCYPQDAHPRAAFNSNEILNTDFGKGDKPMRVYIQSQYFDAVDREINVLAYQSASDVGPVADEITIDTQRMQQVLLVNPLGQICEAIDIDIHAALKGQTQTGLGAF